MARPSPFPGMDPYLERHWLDVHADLVTLCRSALNEILPPDLVARMEERIVIDSIHYERPRAIYPDVRVYEQAAPAKGAAGVQSSNGGIEVAEPILLELEAEERTESYVTILDPDGGKAVTVIEFLSPANKLPGEGRSQYRKKRDELIAAQVNFVEVDLVRTGDWRNLLLPLVAPADVHSAYRVITRRFHPKRRAELYPLPLRTALPAIPIPLRQQDADAVLQLQPLLDQCYRTGRYDRINYSRECDPPLPPEDAQWAQELLAEAGIPRVSG